MRPVTVLATTLAVVLVWITGPAAALATSASPVPRLPAILDDPGDGPTLVFVHGILNNYNDPRFEAILTQVVDPSRVVVLEYYQDAGYKDSQTGECTEGSPVPEPSVQTPNGDMPVVHQGDADDYCDSMSSIALNAVRLHDRIVQLYASTGYPVVLLGHSMGAAIIRGAISYSAELGDDVASTMIDSVFFLEGAQDGSYVIPMIQAGAFRQPWLVPLAQVFGAPNADRPAVSELAPQSSWYEWANPGNSSRLPYGPYYNAYGDIRLQPRACAFVFCVDFGPTQSIGDVALLPGTDDPFDTPAEGGAKFLWGSSGPSWEWDMTTTVPVGYNAAVIGPTVPGPDLSWITSVFEQPQYHFGFKDRVDQVHVLDCQTFQDTTLDVQLLKLINDAMGGQPYHCQLGT